MSVHLSASDIAFAAILALFLTWGVLSFSKMFKLSFKPLAFDYHKSELDSILKKCYGLFPGEIIAFQGKIFKRGMCVRVITNKRKIIEGELIGLNSDNMLCLMTSHFVVAHDLASIEEMILIKEAE